SAIAVALETGDPIGRVLAGLLEDLPDHAGRDADLYQEIPFHTVALREVAAALTTRLVRTTSREAGPADLAEWLMHHSNRLSECGRREAALAAVEESVSIRRELAEARPEAFRPALATSLTNFSARLSELGRREAALAAIEEAVNVRRE